MEFVVKRPERRFEIRESESTPRGPRARTLVTFRELTDEVLDVAAERSRGSLDRARLKARAIALGAEVGPSVMQLAAHQLITAHARGERLPVAVRDLLQHVLDVEASATAHDEPTDHLASMLQWIGATEDDRAIALADLLELADALPAPRRGALRYPRFEPR